MNRQLLNDIRKAMSKRSLLYVSGMLDKELQPPRPHVKYAKKEPRFDKITTRTEKRILKDTKTKII